MLTQSQIDRIAAAVLCELEKRPDASAQESAAGGAASCKIEAAAQRAAVEQAQRALEAAAGRIPAPAPAEESAFEDWRSPASKAVPLLAHPKDADGLRRMMRRTTARIGVGRAGPRLKTKTLLTLRADHAAARDAVFTDVDPALIERLHLLPVVTRCADKNSFLTRPDLGRSFDEENRETIVRHCAPHPDVQLIVSDGLSSSAINANAERILPVVTEGLKSKGLTVGTPIFVKYGRVAAQDQISELLDAKVVCSFIGERPGLATAESMSAYIAYRAAVGMPEARRTVVSNIHKNGVPAVEAGAYIVDLLALILEKQASGVDLKK